MFFGNRKKFAAHREMARPAKLFAWNPVLPGRRKLKMGFGHGTRDRLQIVAGLLNTKFVHGVGAGYAQAHRNSGRHQYALRDENILLGNHPHGDGSVGFLGRSQIAFDEFPLQMQSGRIDYRTAEIAPDRLVNFIVTSSGYGAAEQSDRQNKEES